MNDTEALTDTLWDHLLYGGGDTGDDPECKCGAVPPETWWEEDFGEIRWHHAHLASLFAAHVAAARAAALRGAADAADRSCITGLETTRPDIVARWLRGRALRAAVAVPEPEATDG